MGESYDGRAAVPSISREGVTQKSCRVTATQSIIKVTEQSVCFGRGGVTAFTEGHVTGVLVKPVIMRTSAVQTVVAASSIERSSLTVSSPGTHRYTFIKNSSGCTVHLPAPPEVVTLNKHPLVAVLEEIFI